MKLILIGVVSMKVLILAGGYGTRLAEGSESLPKPMVPIGGEPIILHIMKYYAQFNHKDFILALGYKAEVIKKYFLQFAETNSNILLDLQSSEGTQDNSSQYDWRIALVDTGIETLTGGRVKRLQKYVGDETCLLTYGDGLSTINIDKLINFHHSHGKLVTVSAVRPIARFGELDIHGNKVNSFKEKPQTTKGWINGGYFVIEPGFFDLIQDRDNSVLELEPLEQASTLGQLMAYKHEGFWRCMDTKRDKDSLEEIWQTGSAPWKA